MRSGPFAVVVSMFTVIYADPAWKFRNEKTGGNHASGASQHYPTMSLPDIQRLPVPAVVGHPAVLFLWVPTSLKFSHGPTVAMAWGFDHYVTTVYWDKERLGMGFWFRNVVEELLVFTKGDHAPFRCQLPNIIRCRPGEHSEKPEQFRRLIETATGDATRRRYLELFARRTAPGWTSMGHGVSGGVDLRAQLLGAHLEIRADEEARNRT